MTEFISPTLSYSLLSPILVVFAGAIIGVLIEAFASKSIRGAPARPIVEADAFVTRWQQLAGIKK